VELSYRIQGGLLNPPQSFHSNRLYKFMDLAAGMQIHGYDNVTYVGRIGKLKNVYISGL